MRNHNNSVLKFIKNSAVFLIGNIMSKVILVLLLPLYTSALNPADYGYYDVSITYITAVTSILFFEIWSGVMRFMYDKSEKNYKYYVIKSGWTIFAVSGVLYFVILFALDYFTTFKYLNWIFLYGFFTNIQSMYSYIARGFGKNTEFAVSGILNTAVTVTANIVFILAFHWGIVSLYIASIIGMIMQELFLEFKVHTLGCVFKYPLNRNLTFQIFKYSAPVCLNTISFWLLTSLNRILINFVLGNAANGIYAIADKFGAAITLITTCFTYAWQDISFSRESSSSGGGRFYSRACNAYMRFLGVGAVLMIPAFFILFPLLVNKTYNESKNIIPLFLVMSMMGAFSNFIGNIFYAMKKTNVIFISMMASCFLNILIGYPLILLIGLNGATLAIVIAYILNITIRTIILSKANGFRLNYRLALMIAILICTSFIIYTFGNFAANIIWLIVAMVLSWFILKDTFMPIFKSILEKRNS